MFFYICISAQTGDPGPGKVFLCFFLSLLSLPRVCPQCVFVQGSAFLQHRKGGQQSGGCSGCVGDSIHKTLPQERVGAMTFLRASSGDKICRAQAKIHLDQHQMLRYIPTFPEKDTAMELYGPPACITVQLALWKGQEDCQYHYNCFQTGGALKLLPSPRFNILKNS